MDKLKNIKCTLVSQVQSELTDMKKVNTKELGEVIDMIKDLEEAMYYCSIIQAMEDNKEDKEQKYSSINYYMEPGVKNYTPYMEYAPYMMRDEKWRDTRLYNTADRTYNSRRMYMESKQNQATDQQSMKELEHYIKDLGDDLTDMIRDSSTEEKQVLSTKLQQLASKVTKP